MEAHTRLFVGNLPLGTSDSELRSEFEKFGEIVNIDVKSKPTDENPKTFAFITLAATNYNLESCIKYFCSENFKGNRLYVTKARESFLERLHREREQDKQKTASVVLEESPFKNNPVIKLSNKLNPGKRKIVDHINDSLPKLVDLKVNIIEKHSKEVKHDLPKSEVDKKKQDADNKRLESMKKKRQEFRQKKNIIKTGLCEIDQVSNKKIIFSDNEDEMNNLSQTSNRNGYSLVTQKKSSNKLFDDDNESDSEVNFEIKQQFEGKKGQKVLNLQSKYKSDRRFMLDERFVEEDESDKETNEEAADHENIDVGQSDEKAKQLGILQDVLGVVIKQKTMLSDTDKKKSKSIHGMLRFDPTHPEHAKYLAPVEEVKNDLQKKTKKKKTKDTQSETLVEETNQEVQKIEVSKEQFYKVSEDLKEAIAQPHSFSLRSLFSSNQDEDRDNKVEQESGCIPLGNSKKQKSKNPLDLEAKNPFVYDSSDSETEEKNENIKMSPVKTDVEAKAVWRENLFFMVNDTRLKDALAFFNNTHNELPKERRELKSIMKKRMYNNQRKNQMFKKKIGGRKSTANKTIQKRK